MKQRAPYLLTSMIFAALTLSGCGMYIGSPPSKTEVRETTVPAPQPPPPQVHVYTPPN